MTLCVTASAFGQKTTEPILGFCSFRLGDPVEKINSYGYTFKENKVRANYDYFSKEALYEEENFCENSKVFSSVENEISINGVEFVYSGIFLTYFNNKLINIFIKGLPKQEGELKEILIQKYGKNYGKIYLPGYYLTLQKYKKKGVAISQSARAELEHSFLSSVYWEQGGILISYGGSNTTYDFAESHYKETLLAESGLLVRDLEVYSKMIICSNLEKQEHIKKIKNGLKDKASQF